MVQEMIVARRTMEKKLEQQCEELDEYVLRTDDDSVQCRMCNAEVDYHPHDGIVCSGQCQRFGGAYNEAIVIRACDFCDDGYDTRTFCDPTLCDSCAVQYREIRNCENCAVKEGTVNFQKVSKKHLGNAIEEMIIAMKTAFEEVKFKGKVLRPDFEFPDSKGENFAYLTELVETTRYLYSVLKWGEI